LHYFLPFAQGLRPSLLLNAACGSQIDATVGPATYVYHQGYAWDGNAWNPLTYDCTGGAKVSNAWCPGTAQASLPAGTGYYLAYTCAYVNNTWKCGCRDQQCSANYWQLQKVN
jgi:hypothetical protein